MMSGVRKAVVVESDGSSERSRSSAPSGRPEGGREVRWSAPRKQEVVLRLLRGESLDVLARETGQAAGTIAGWREDFRADLPPARVGDRVVPDRREPPSRQRRARRLP